MPRYQMHAEDLADLIAYLKRLEHQLDPGVSEAAITVGTILPEEGGAPALGEAIKAVIRGYFADVNGQGGIYGRRLELKVAAAPTRDLALARSGELIEGGTVFALVAAVTAGLESELDEAVERNGIPLIGPFTQFPVNAEAMHRFTFHLFGGLAVQAQALAEYASRKLAPRSPRIAVVYPRERKLQGVAQGVRAQAGERGWPQPLEAAYAPREMNAKALAAELEGKGVNALIFLGPGAELLALAREGGKHRWTPYLLAPGALAGDALIDLPGVFQGRIFLAYPTGPADYSAAGAAKFNEFQRRHGLPRHHMSAQIATYAAVELLAEGLKAACRSVSRDKLVGALERLYGFETGLTPPLTFGPNRRIGAWGAHVVAQDLSRRSVAAESQWVTLK